MKAHAIGVLPTVVERGRLKVSVLFGNASSFEENGAFSNRYDFSVK
jgi:hypothetical protein